MSQTSCENIITLILRVGSFWYFSTFSAGILGFLIAVTRKGMTYEVLGTILPETLITLLPLGVIAFAIYFLARPIARFMTKDVTNL